MRLAVFGSWNLTRFRPLSEALANVLSTSIVPPTLLIPDDHSPFLRQIERFASATNTELKRYPINPFEASHTLRRNRIQIRHNGPYHNPQAAWTRNLSLLRDATHSFIALPSQANPGIYRVLALLLSCNAPLTIYDHSTPLTCVSPPQDPTPKRKSTNAPSLSP